MSNHSLEDMLERVVDLDYGIVKFLTQVPLQSIEGDIHIVFAEHQDPYLLMPDKVAAERNPDALRVAGAGLDLETATWSCIGEAIERYSAGWHDQTSTFYGTRDQLPTNHVLTPDDFIMFADDQYEQQGFRFPRYSQNSRLKWKKIQRLRDGELFWAPACLICFDIDLEHKDDWHAPGISTGLACGPSKEWAIATGMRELIERDGFSLHWLTKTSPPAVKIKDLKGRIDDRAYRLATAPHSVTTVLDITTEIGVPTILAITKPKFGGGVALGASTHLDFFSAVERAIVESFHTYNWVIDIDRWNREYIKKKDVSNFKDHVAFYLDPQRTRELDFLISKNATPANIEEITSPKAELSHEEQISVISDLLLRNGHEVYVVDVTPPDVIELGLHVHRVVCPTLHPLWAGSNHIFKNRRRIDSFLEHRGMSVDVPLNSNPHPFP